MSGRRVPVEANKRGTALPQAKLDDARVRWIRATHANGMPLYRLAQCVGMSYGAIWKVANYETWRHVR